MIAWSAISHLLLFSLKSDTLSPLLHARRGAAARAEVEAGAGRLGGPRRARPALASQPAAPPRAAAASPEPQRLQAGRELGNGVGQLRKAVLHDGRAVRVHHRKRLAILRRQVVPAAGQRAKRERGRPCRG